MIGKLTLTKIIGIAKKFGILPIIRYLIHTDNATKLLIKYYDVAPKNIRTKSDISDYLVAINVSNLIQFCEEYVNFNYYISDKKKILELFILNSDNFANFCQKHLKKLKLIYTIYNTENDIIKKIYELCNNTNRIEYDKYYNVISKHYLFHKVPETLIKLIFDCEIVNENNKKVVIVKKVLTFEDISKMYGLNPKTVNPYFEQNNKL